MEFRISRSARERLDIRGPLLAPGISSPAFNLPHLAAIAKKLGEEPLSAGAEPRPSELAALLVIDAIFRRILVRYGRERNSGFARALLDSAFAPGLDDLTRTLLDSFLVEYPSVAVQRGEPDPLDGKDEATLAALVEEVLLLRIKGLNPAVAPFRELISEEHVETHEALSHVYEACRKRLDSEPGFGPGDSNLVELLLTPARLVPDSLVGQLGYILSNWGFMVPDLIEAILRTMDFAKEEDRWFSRGLEGKSTETPVPDFTGGEAEPEAYSTDLDWMPRVVLMAKNTWVWLDQLSRKYGRDISRLDQVPDSELDLLSSWGITSLWLIGVWERSPASREIKRLMGNPEALASAYSLMRYEVAADLGGEAAFESLKSKAWQRGIRMATDMVPNHTGIDSHWVMDHPERFISTDTAPFPVYTFEGPELSWRDDVSIKVETRYWTREDAAVVFRRIDRKSGETRYIYHGNDGTSTPWNDTAQLDFLDPVVREAVIREIVQVARKSPVIRFDAAMTLAKRHFQRLWYPQPGGGGAIPSRAERGISKADFEAAIPTEFWREVVDRIQAEQPQTLLLAEAFWLMEGFFVRTLGMHRVYNSAFMNMLSREENANYRQVLKNTLEFDTEVLKRFVNFMSNPDEETSLNQFGKGDKYFGICTLMCTFPGLPMFGHGQIEGFREKYGMEYRRAYLEESSDPDLVARHERQIFPLLKRRPLFAGSENFLLYDLFDDGGTVNEDVFAFSNRRGAERAVVLYNNRYARADGWIRWSTGFADGKTGAGDRGIARRTLAEGLDLTRDEEVFYVFRELSSGLERIRPGRELSEKGLRVGLDAYETRVFLDFRELRDSPDGRWRRLSDSLGTSGVADLDSAMEGMLLEDFRRSFVEGSARFLTLTSKAAGGDKASVAEAEGAGKDLVERLFASAAPLRGFYPDRSAAVSAMSGPAAISAAVSALAELAPRSRDALAAVSLLASAALLSAAKGGDAGRSRPAALVEKLGMWNHIRKAAEPLAADPQRATDLFGLAGALIDGSAAGFSTGHGSRLAASILEDEGSRRFLKVNEWEGHSWISAEALSDLVGTLAVAHLAATSLTDGFSKVAAAARKATESLLGSAESAAYRLDLLLAALSREEEPGDGVDPEVPGPSPDLRP